MNLEHFHLTAVVAAALATFVVGGLWYSPLLLGRVWMRANAFTEEQVEKFSKPRMFGWSLVFSLVMAANLGVFLADESTNAAWGMTAGALAGVGWVSMAIAVVALFENRSWRYILVNAGYQSVAFTLMGLIIGAWR